MHLELKGLLIDQTSIAQEALEMNLRPDIEFEYLEFVNTVHKALQFHMESECNICFIGENFPLSDVQGFFRDYSKLQKKEPCVFVQVREKVDLDFDRSSLKSIGFDTVISFTGDFRDKNAIWPVLKSLLDKKEHEETLGNLDNIIESLINELDKTAQERKRGAKNKLSKIYSDYIKDSVRKFDGLSDKFYERLTDASQVAVPFIASKIDMPEDILAKNLPHLSKDKYKGQSHRVWDKLLNRHGLADKEREEAVTSDDPEKKRIRSFRTS